MGQVIVWTDEMIQMLKDLSTSPLSASQIGAKLEAKFNRKFTRNSVIGKFHRLNISFGKSNAQKEEVKKNSPPRKLIKAPAKPQSPKQVLEIKPKKDLKLSTITILAEPVKKNTHSFSNPKALGVTLMDLMEGMCKYPMGDVKNDDIIFCGAIADSKHRSYCSHCYPIVYMPIRKYREMTAKKPQQPSKDI